jgi:tRNA-uridine 2-sulfurtransferase
MKSDKRVVVALSGGVDSAVAAGLLLEEGYQVIGATLHLWSDDKHETADQIQERYADALTICKQLGIEHNLLDRKDQFREIVIAEFLSEYLQGRTPNPCVLCNREIKWRLLMKLVDELDADYLATGHYAGLQNRNGMVQLTKAKHNAKDQSYMLWKLPVNSLSRTLFPLGALTKEETRRHAAKMNLSVEDKAESQDICFVPDGDYGSFLQQAFPEKMGAVQPGHLLDESGNILGNHRGIPYYTIGQRKGLGIALGEARFVSSIDPRTNAITVTAGESLFHHKLKADQVNWLTLIPAQPFRATARIRYHDPGESCQVIPLTENSITVEFDHPRRAITPGQSVVIYDNDVVLGGGIIGESFE